MNVPMIKFYKRKLLSFYFCTSWWNGTAMTYSCVPQKISFTILNILSMKTYTGMIHSQYLTLQICSYEQNDPHEQQMNFSISRLWKLHHPNIFCSLHILYRAERGHVRVRAYIANVTMILTA